MGTLQSEKFEHTKGVVWSHEKEDASAMMKRQTDKKTNNGLQSRTQSFSSTNHTKHNIELR